MSAPDFSEKIKRILFERAGDKCSNPDCGSYTHGPHKDDCKSINIGEAAHIKGARPGSKRFDPLQTDDERSAIQNGIWLCKKCAKLIDSDELTFTIERLAEWKLCHEQNVLSQLKGHRTEIDIREEVSKILDGESTYAKLIATDKPKYWVYLLLAELLQNKYNLIDKELSELRRGLRYKRTVPFAEDYFIPWIQATLADLSNIIQMIATVINEDLMAIFRKGSQKTKVEEILYVSDKIADSGLALVEWESDIMYTAFPDELQDIKNHMRGWVTDYINEIGKIPHELRYAVQNSKSFTEKPYTIDITFNPPANIHNIVNELERYFKQ